MMSASVNSEVWKAFSSSLGTQINVLVSIMVVHEGLSNRFISLESVCRDFVGGF